MKFKKGDLILILTVLRSQITWGAGGCFGDGNDIEDKKSYKRAVSLVGIIEEYLKQN